MNINFTKYHETHQIPYLRNRPTLAMFSANKASALVLMGDDV